MVLVLESNGNTVEKEHFEFGANLEDWPADDDLIAYRRNDGLWIWEGEVNEDENGDMEWEGEFRRLTDEELQWANEGSSVLQNR